MDDLLSLILLIVGLFIGAVIGFFIGRSRAFSSSSGDATYLGLLNAQLTEMKVKFFQMETARADLETERGSRDLERERRLTEWMESTRRLFSEQTEMGRRVDDEKEKRLKEWMDATKTIFSDHAEKERQVSDEKEKRLKEWMERTVSFIEEQKTAHTTFLAGQEKTREEIEKKRDGQLSEISAMISSFTRAVAGTQTRGRIGEEQLRSVLNASIRSGLVRCNLKTSVGEVEFAWNLEDGKYIPIDCKMSDVFALLDEYSSTQDADRQGQIRKRLNDTLKDQVKLVTKYQNLENTIDSCILVLPEGILETSPELVSLGMESHVYICSYKDVFPLAYLIHEKYHHMKRQGDVGEYRQIITVLLRIADEIWRKTEAIGRALKTIENANDAIQREVRKAKNAHAPTVTLPGDGEEVHPPGSDVGQEGEVRRADEEGI